MPYFRRKTQPVLRAWQWDGTAADMGLILDQLPPSTRDRIELRHQPKPGLEYLWRGEPNKPVFFPVISTPVGPLQMFSGNWLVLDERGLPNVYDNTSFKTLFEPMEDPTSES